MSHKAESNDRNMMPAYCIDSLIRVWIFFME